VGTGRERAESASASAREDRLAGCGKRTITCRLRISISYNLSESVQQLGAVT
jgi:hypothetical protein